MTTCSPGWDARCRGSTGRRCRCACGGQNHGSAVQLKLFQPPAPEPMRRARYDIVNTSASAVVIRDVGPWDVHASVTEDADAVVEELAAILEGRRLYFIDLEGRVDEILVSGGRFLGFAPGWPTLEAALASLAEREVGHDFTEATGLAQRVDDWLRAVIAEDDGKALALCPFSFGAFLDMDQPEGRRHVFRIRLRPDAPGENALWIGGAGSRPIEAIRRAIGESIGLSARIIELEACP